ncbi:hypothetical protein, variant [Aphanomyces astaci]|uniref:AB hydrolase-1 domain-containing protein n=1 Tax=Aphanomyces astaci TaxID=112090 RepID=W4F961_APHAT|nr:hypothetical protein, variant [Aphanomyces astaci]ETV64025.1 hypothetical protein, variant [Aphanomyces astaci]|eukprot:XP_009846493.1 hypothetical protein, variant [Aphanomyces astaci]
MCTLSAPMLMARPILVTIPDFLGHGIQMLPAEMFLSSPWGGSFNVLRFRYDAHRQTLQESGQDLLGVLHDIKPISGLEPSYIVTHGYGALVLREALRCIDWHDVRTRLVMVAPPNRGLLKPTWCFTANVARSELLTLQDFDLDMRLGKLPRRTSSLVVAGALPLHRSHAPPSDGVVSVAHTHMPGEYTHMILPAPHNLIMAHPATLRLARDFLLG